jgi:poly [ADP-ribose] polymerase 1
MPNWYHFGCFFKKAKPSDTCFIRNFDSLRWDDQQRIKQKMGLEVADKETKNEANGDEGDEEENETFSLEYAKSNRSKCHKCEVRIEKVNLNRKSK